AAHQPVSSAPERETVNLGTSLIHTRKLLLCPRAPSLILNNSLTELNWSPSHTQPLSTMGRVEKAYSLAPAMAMREVTVACSETADLPCTAPWDPQLSYEVSWAKLSSGSNERLELPQSRQNSSFEAPRTRSYSLTIQNTTVCSSGTYRNLHDYRVFFQISLNLVQNKLFFQSPPQASIRGQEPFPRQKQYE
ncbi:hypothetical protein STEG23_016076, partial [Scotinomys teguina]